MLDNSRKYDCSPCSIKEMIMNENVEKFFQNLAVLIAQEFFERFGAILLKNSWSHLIFLMDYPVRTTSIQCAIRAAIIRSGGRPFREHREKMYITGTVATPNEIKIDAHYAALNDSKKGWIIYIRLCPDID